MCTSFMETCIKHHVQLRSFPLKTDFPSRRPLEPALQLWARHMKAQIVRGLDIGLRFACKTMLRPRSEHSKCLCMYAEGTLETVSVYREATGPLAQPSRSFPRASQRFGTTTMLIRRDIVFVYSSPASTLLRILILSPLKIRCPLVWLYKPQIATLQSLQRLKGSEAPVKAMARSTAE